ncbi:MAG: glycosyltransferase family 39 protein [Betaproteobacteria bacterium]|nr:glycosyltransferase family 39 protein [Betaproteobacteria bacterium]
MSTAAGSAPRGLWLMLLVAIIIWSSNLEYRKLALTDEGRYAEIPRYMAQSGDWITPRLNGIKYFEKPPLQYWATAAAYSVFGEYHWTARLWPAVTGFLGALLMFHVGARLYGANAGLYAALVLGSSFLYTAIAHINTLDMGLTFFLGLALTGILLALEPRADARQNRLWMHVAWAGCALAVLSKGLIGVALPVTVLVLYMLVKRDFMLWRKLHLVSGGLLFLAISVPWFVAVSIANPEFPQFFFIHEHLTRYTTTIHQRYQAWYYFIPILLIGILPWLVTSFDALLRTLKQPRAAGFDPTLFLLLWAGFIFVFFSISGSKLASYILPIFPALALIIAVRLTTISGRALAWQLAPVAVLALAGLIAAPYTVRLASASVPVELYQNQIPWLHAAAVTLLAGSIGAMIYSWRGHVRRAVVVCAFAGLATTQLALTSHDSLSPAYSTYHLVQKLKPHLRPNVPFYSVGGYEQTLPFYIKRTVTLVDYQDEMAFGLMHEPQLWVPDLAGFERRWRGHDYALAVMGPEIYEQMQQAQLPMQLIARDTERVFVRTPPRQNQGG